MSGPNILLFQRLLNKEMYYQVHYTVPVPLHLLMMCHVLVHHQKHYNVCSMFVMNIHGMLFPP
jgi:hypothetical protein